MKLNDELLLIAMVGFVIYLLFVVVIDRYS